MSKDMSIKLNIDATDFKRELNELEAQLDRVLKKKEKLCNTNLEADTTSPTFPNGDSIGKIAEALAEKMKTIPRLGLR